MRQFVAVLSLVLVCFSSGCAKHYYQEGKTLGQCKQAGRDCYAEFKKYQDPDDTEELPRLDVVYDYEGNFMDACMKEKGYRIVAENKLPLRVKREAPDRWVRQDRGFAGTLDE